MIKTKIIGSEMISSEKNFQKKIIVNLDQEIYLLIRRIELNYGLSFKEARNSVSIAVKKLYSIDTKEKLRPEEEI